MKPAKEATPWVNAIDVPFGRGIKGIMAGHSIARVCLHTCVERLAFRPGTILDLGGSPRSSYRGLLPSDARIITVDAQSNVAADHIMNLEDPLTIPAESVDNVALFNVLEHIYNYKQLLGECRRVVASGGLVVVFVPFLIPFHEQQMPTFHIRDYFRYTETTLRRLGEEAQFTDVRVSPVGGVCLVGAEIWGVVVKMSFLRVIVFVLSYGLERVMRRFRKFDSVRKYPLAYLAEFRK